MKRVWPVIVVCLTLLVSGCGGDDQPETPVASGPATIAPTPVGPAGTVSPITAATPAPITREGQLVGDGVCQARVPIAWSEDTPGTGTTGGGHAFSIFGNSLASEDAWETAITLLKSQETRQPGAALIEGEAFVRITYPDASGLAYRARFGGVACDIRITGRSAPIPEGERATWDAIIASLEPVVSR